jgi:hypothetical protein
MSLLRAALRSSLKNTMQQGMGRNASTLGVVRIVKAPGATDIQTPDLQTEGVGSPLLNRSNVSLVTADRVSVDLRAADLFRQFKQNSDKATLISVLQGLSAMKLDGKVLSTFPGFIDLMQNLNKKLSACEFTADEFEKVVEVLWRLGIRNTEGFGNVSSGFSSQIVALLEELPKVKLVKIVSRLEIDVRVRLDTYAYWCMNKEINRWASDPSIEEREFIKHVLGPLQVLAQKQLVSLFQPVFSNSKIEDRMINLIDENKLNGVQIVELILKLKDAGYPRMIQRGINAVLKSHKEKLMENLNDTAVLISALPREASMRDSNVQKQLVEILLNHYQSEHEKSADRIKTLLKCTGELLINGQDPQEQELIKSAWPLASNNALILSKVDPDTLANLHYVSATAAVTHMEPFLTLCKQTESVIVGRLPHVSPSELAKLSLSFASGILSHPNSLRALGATIRQKAPHFSPSDFVDAVYGLAYKGLISKAILVEGEVDTVAVNISVSALPRMAWAVAVADHSVATVWDTLIRRIEKEILIKPDVLEKLSSADECMLYEALVTCKVNRHVPLSKNADRRIDQFQTAWKRSDSELDYVAMIRTAGLEIRTNYQPRKLEFALTMIPLYLPEYQLVLDATKNPVVESAGLTNGSVKLRHRLLSKLGFNVIGISDSQFANCKSDDERAAMLGSLIGQFVNELQLKKRELPPPKTESRSNDWSSRDPSENPNEWGSRTSPVPRNKSFDRVSGWASRDE